MAEDLEPQGVPVGAIGECVALNALLKEIEDKKAETISTLARDNVELTWELQDLKFQQNVARQVLTSPTAVLLSPPRPQGPQGECFFLF
jgi:hypothetical protein